MYIGIVSQLKSDKSVKMTILLLIGKSNSDIIALPLIEQLSMLLPVENVYVNLFKIFPSVISIIA
ncbi:MAG: hypothetical protein BWX61_00600 [Bacteroidetes bacterium ADurb.Bin035]|nr:MAG: hypothetical protein BWX61_00600 [Bacteroidetes bacterium ADurb.Bin035]